MRKFQTYSPQLSKFNMLSTFAMPSQHFATGMTSRPKIPMNNNLIGMIEWYRRNAHKMAKVDPL